MLTELKPWRVAIVFLFGLARGMGFASSLNEIGILRNEFFPSSLSFNAGVETRQITVITAMFVAIIIPFKKFPDYGKIVVIPLWLAIALIGAWRTVQRIFF